MSGALKRLNLQLPQNHPVFCYPPRIRAKVAREWLDLGMRLAAIEERLAKLEERGAVPSASGADNGEGKKIDPIKFRETLAGVFDF
ncbi:hypothetical protein E308F_10680 [Moorella sp. E308F]|uniref:hypothetical protein n=1 Tax=Moorella sp. E308F TaxID=2572682 RepID=UPI0010FFC2B4|nr:hypothetical protein [Moorella sp. E308F]GEA14826.1 hypothetical protein E308F_10680 [Moorella sp. E308F]